ncbi:adenylosuccinate lyase [candidate division WOR-1 bacterium RIFOXYA12_FULL_43_27]|uniref:Adenylosuccinate lyase n=1 Tax=candidate division WOR-1 bacterium RIFOXYC2_FULL_46_14 TaxID=1802587 RepID=A0A1F4U8A8_UNCSA|nr:MAG: adenylosuccinate lyase [candidate division WOR-1 bacterium RIFOXYA12_FULL_43_27]OGC20039.1 MAG: adenylosuccinate lyase [candidate division WOR-1 bacterium RIFOXYB2_FULL_46_45]OGC32225.1 MAG: adenylosuccinate lyase [candidate division WOR-1 bacterium RIFOXYA2_FULL_46_56]OGC41129.1 MAG: adenylosuccinate lyase [candidate division WOR-1 bacterium RIFOXYC2_FULL_46_14]
MIERYTTEKMGKIWSEENKFQKWLDVELAACEAWAKLKKIPSKSLKKIKEKAAFSIDRINQIEKTVDHDVIAFLTSVAEKVGQDSRYIHMGMTSSDVVDTALSLQLKEASDIIIDNVERFILVLKKTARKHKNTIMVGRSHGIHAEPTTFGLKMALYIEEMQRNLVRVQEAKKIISVGKLSGAVGTYSNIDPQVEAIACENLGLTPVSVASQVIQRDRHAQFLAALAITAATLEKIATEIRGLQRTEVAEVEEPFRQGQKGSSAMPHKRNPIVCERVCGLARLVRANSMVALENIALWHERDISHSSTERVILPDSAILLDYMLQKMITVINDLKIFPDKMRENLELTRGRIYSQRLLLMLAGKGLTREEAYRLVQDDAMESLKTSTNLKVLVMANKKITKHLSLKEIDSAFSTAYYLRNIKSIFRKLGL